ncbi:hypothetical protein [Streptomyces sp. MAR4 CNX-425]|uniref:hypothetical protein n=1 Tax=Streptomyces sp. MAR4 CNX-425 TaxID=3406343 RepID=UPI003B502F4F
MRNARIHQGLVALLAAVVMAIGFAGSASAHAVYSVDYPWHNSAGDHCMVNKSQVGDGESGGGEFKGWSESGFNEVVPFVDCEYPRNRPAGHLADGMQIWVVSPATNEWVLCARTDKTYYNTKEAFSLQLTWTAPAAGMCFTDGSYGLYNHAAIHSDGDWTPTFNNPLWSGVHHNLGWPTSSAETAASTKSAPRPPWVNADGTMDPEKMPDKAKVADPDGGVVTDKDGKPVKVNTRLPAPEMIPANGGGGQRTTKVAENGGTVEVVEVDMVRVADTL